MAPGIRRSVLPLPIQSEPIPRLVVVARDPQHMDVFRFAGDNSLATTYFDGSWHPSFGIAPPNIVRGNSPLVALARTPNNVDVFWFSPF